MLKRGRGFSPPASLVHTAIVVPLAIAEFFTPGRIAFGQQAATPSFEVASVKRSTSTDRGFRMDALPGGTLVFTNVPLRMIIIRAYGLPFNVSQRLSGGPEWINSERFDIEAKAPQGVITPGLSEKSRNDKLMPMLQTLLADRFKLAIDRQIERPSRIRAGHLKERPQTTERTNRGKGLS